MRLLTVETLKEQLADCLLPNEINAILARRDKIVAFFDKKIAQEGKDRVLYDMPSRELQWTAPLPLKSIKQ